MATLKIKIRTPFGVTRYPHISSPDTKGKYADGKFKTKLVMKASDPEAQKLAASMDAAVKQAHGKAAGKYVPYVLDEDENEYVFTFKSQYAPAIFDSRGKPMAGKTIGGGSVVRLAATLVEFDKGVAAQINQVQVKELNGFGECGFDAIDDGYEFDGSEDASSTFGSDDNEEDASPANGSNDALDI